MADKPDTSDSKNVEFLSEQFGVAPEKAAELVTDDQSKAKELGAEQLRKEHDSDALDGLPTPAEPDRDWVEDSDEERLKPVLHENRRPRQ